MNQLKVYPSSVSSDFSPGLISAAQNLINLSMDVIGKELTKCVNEKKSELLLCTLRILLESEFNCKNATLLGWFLLNQLMPLPTQYLLFSIVLQHRKTLDGLRAIICFTKILLPRINKFPVFCKNLISTPLLRFYDSDLYILLKQIADGAPIAFESYSFQYRFVIPEKEPKFPTLKPLPPPPELLHDSSIQPKQNIFASLDYAATLQGEQQKLFLIQVCLKFKPPSVSIDFPPLLQAACEYTLILMNSVKGQGWKSFDIFPWLDHMGTWVNALSISIGRPPPIYMIDIPRMLKDSAVNGTFCAAMVFMIAFFRKALSVYSPPCPYTTACLEVMAAVMNVPGIRSDVITLIKNFGLMFNVDVNMYYRRSIDIPIASFDRYAVFVKDESGNVFRNAKKGEKTSNTMNNVTQYFSYHPSTKMLTGKIKEIAEKANEIEKYYFVGSPTDIIPISGASDNLAVLQSIVSLAMSDSTVLASTALKLFKKMTSNIAKIDLSGLFRYVFPHPTFFSIIVEKGFYNISTINDLFCDLLSNPVTSTVSKPFIIRYIKMLPSSLELRSLYTLIGARENPQIAELPQPDKALISLLQSFYFLCKNPTDSARLEFVNQLSPANQNQMKTLLLAVLHATQKMKKIDYSVVDFLCSVLSRCTSKISPDTIICNAQKAIESLPSDIFKNKKNSLVIFRFFYSFLNGVNLKQKDKLLALCEFLSPKNYASFTCCWMQLCMHPQCFPQFIRKNDVKYQQFCLSFVQTIIDLAIRMPDGFYKPVTIILMLIASDYPSFLVQYYAVLIDSLPLRFIQFRNIILNAAPQEFSPDKNPAISFQYIDALETKALILNVKPFLRLEIPENVSTASNIQFIISTLRRAASQSEYTPSLFWQFALYCISKASAAIPTEKIGCASEFAALPIISMFKQLASAFGVDADCLLINGIIDQIRFPSSHTVIASEILFTLFEESPSYVRELIYTEIVRRLLCVTQPPRSVKAIYLRITSKYKQQLTKMFNESDQKNAFLKISSVIDA